ncbi:MAG: hypothetical protein PQJ59_03665 [Spirochaetales bacterium]|nr:hypothetical protein [Spirochaetales bacterium]
MSYPLEQSITSLIEEKTGIGTIPINELNMESFINRRITQKQWKPGEYLSFLGEDKEEFQALIDFITINETYFFREEKSFRFLEKHIIPSYIREGKSINVLSAGCSTGEEALSLYALLMNSLPEALFTVHALDINQQVLDHFKKGVYAGKALRKDGQEHHYLLDRIKKGQDREGRLCIDQRIIEKINIHRTNLFEDSFEFLPPMDLIFLKNTLIYMESRNKHKIIDKFTRHLRVGGLLITAAPEVALISHPQLQVEEREGYYFLRKRDPRTLSRQKLQSTLEENTLRTQDAPQPPNRLPHRQEVTTDQKKEPPFTPPKEEELCLLITDILNNSCSLQKENQTHQLAEKLVALLYLIESGELSRANSSFDDLPAELFPSSLYNYLGGFIALQMGDGKKASEYLASSLKENPRFWPARYFSLFSLESSRARKESELKILIDQINDYIEQNRIDYQFLLEGFNARYFLEICKNGLAKLEKGTINGHR